MESIDNSAITSYSHFKVWSAIAIGVGYFWLIYGYDPKERWEIIVYLIGSLCIFVLVYIQRRLLYLVIKPLLFNSNNSEEYKSDLIKYVTNVQFVINVEYMLVVLILFIGFFGEINPKYYAETIHNHQSLPIALLVGGAVYWLRVESQFDRIYFKYFKNEYLEHIKESYK